MVRVWDTRTGKTLSSFTHQVPSPNRSTFTSSSCFFPPQSAVNEVRWSPFKGSNEAEELVTSAVQDARLLFWNTLQVRQHSALAVLSLSHFCSLSHVCRSGHQRGCRASAHSATA